MSTPLRKIIANATTEMLDSPDEHGIYKTTRFYDRLESEVTEYMEGNLDPFFKLITKVVENAEHLNPNMQNVIAKYLDYQSHPKMTINSKALAESLFGKDKE